MPINHVAGSKSPATYLRSLNIDHDRGNKEALSRYVVTANTLRTSSRVLGTIGAGSGAAWTLTGPFGTGKSAFCVFLSHLLAPAKDPLTPDCVRRLQEADSGIADRFFKNARYRVGLQSVTITGSSEPLQTAIIRAFTERDVTASLHLPQLSARRLRALQRCSKSGEVIPSREIVDAVEQLVEGIGSTRSGPRGVLLVIDELGKLLEYAASNPTQSDVFLLQQLAELAERSQGRLLLIGVLHQDFRGYAAGLPPVDRAEWEKIRGRFEDLIFDEPPSQQLRFVALAWQRTREVESLQVRRSADQRLQKVAAHLWEHELAPPGLDLKEGVRLLKAASPLHPLTASLIGPIFRRVGQNTRSAFSFLASDDPMALRSFVLETNRKSRCLYDVVDLYSYLRGAIGNGLLHTPDAKRWAEVFEAESRHPNLSASAMRTLQAIALLNIASRWYRLRPTREVLAYALAERVPAQELDAALDELQCASVIVNRKYNNSYSLWEGSDVDIEARLEEGRSCIAKTEAVASLLRRHHRVRPILARRHGFQSGTLRFFEIEFAHAEDLESIPPVPVEQDGRIIIVLPARGRGPKLSRNALKLFDARTLLRTLPSHDRLFEYALELGAIDWVKRNTPELENDAAARRELHARTLDVERSLDGLIAEMLTAGGLSAGRWIHNGTESKIRSGRQLNEKLSDICDNVYESSPRIDNEIINRRKLSSAAAAARRTLIKRMIESSTLPVLGLDGDPPEKSIYRSVLGPESHLALHRAVKGEWAFRTPSKQSGGYSAFKFVEAFFNSASGGAVSVADLFVELRKPPFGLRDGVIPLIVCTAMLVRESDVALYEDGAFSPELSAATFERLIKSPERFTIRRWRVTGVRSKVFEELERVVGSNEKARGGKTRILNIVRPLLRFVSSLPPYTRQTSQISPITAGIRNALEQATEPDILLFFDLPRACGLDPFEPSQRARTEDIRRYRKSLKASFAELRSVYPTLIDVVRTTIADTFGISEDDDAFILQLQERAAALAEYAVERDLKMLVDRICRPEPDADRWTESVAGFVAERPVEKWRDEDQARFQVRLSQFARRFTLLEATVADRPKECRLEASIRVSLTGTSFGQLDHAVHLGKRAVKQAATLEQALQGVLDDAKDSNVAVAALCEALRRRLVNDS